MDASPHWVFVFGGGRANGAATQRDLLGGKGAYLAEMARLGLPVPPGLTISSEVCAAYYKSDHSLPEALKPMVTEALDLIGDIAGARFGDVENPLLVSVRSGSRASMPGMMDTVLNLGLNDETVEGLARRSSDRRFAYDTYRRFIQMYGDVVLDIDHDLFEEALENYKNLRGFELDTDLKAEHWAEVISRFKAIVEEELGKPFPQDLHVQLWGAIAAVFGSWRNARSRCRPWCSAIWASGARPASSSPAIHQPGTTSFTASFWSMPKARTWSLACARRSL
jgi:pyruvate,orthophosphate dikinase